MGKGKDWSKMGYFEREDYKNQQAKKYGIQGTEYRDSRGNTQTRRNDKALKAAMKNDFDYRTSAQHMDGVKGNGKFGDYQEYEDSAEKLHKQAGNEGSYSSSKDITNVTNNLVKDYQKTLATKDDLDDMSVDSQVSKAKEAVGSNYTESDHLKTAKERVQRYEAGTDAGANDDQRNQATNNFAKYKLNLRD
jgi:hypothetical protein